MAATHLSHLRNVLKEKGAGVTFLDKSQKLEYERISLVAEMGTTSLLRESLTGRTACKKVDVTRLRRAGDGTPNDRPGVRLKNVIALIQGIGVHGRLIEIKGGAHVESRLPQTETQSSGAAKSIDAGESGRHRSIIGSAYDVTSAT